jgi:signal peptidase I
MSPSSSRDGDSPAVIAGGPPQHRPASSAAVDGAGRPGRNVAAHRPAAVRSPQELDYRLRGLSTDPADYVSTAPTRPDRRRRPRRHGPFLAKVAVLVAVAALAAWLLPAFAVQSFSVPSAAMAPTLQAGDRILVAKGLLAGSVHSGEIVVFRPPHFLPCTVVGGGGDLVLRVVDGRPLREQGWYDPRFGQVGSRPIPSTTLVQNQYYVLGDNRSGSCDSRVFGPISGSSIVGEGIAVVVRDGHVFLRKL